MRSYQKIHDQTRLPKTIAGETYQSGLRLVEGNHVSTQQTLATEHLRGNTVQHIPSGVDLDVGKVARGEAVAAGTAHPAGELALVERDPRLERRRRELVVELVLKLLDPALVTLTLVSVFVAM